MARRDVTYVELTGVPPLEVAVEVPRATLETYGLTLDEIAMRIRSASVDVPAGGLDTAKGELLVRVSDRRRLGPEFADIVVRTSPNGSVLTLGEVATIRDGMKN